MNNVDDFIITTNIIPTQLCRSLIRESEKSDWAKHKWSNYGQKESEYSESKTGSSRTSISTIDDITFGGGKNDPGLICPRILGLPYACTATDNILIFPLTATILSATSFCKVRYI